MAQLGEINAGWELMLVRVSLLRADLILVWGMRFCRGGDMGACVDLLVTC
jgi:hypothetical protein